jgi:hypothetical protein
VVAKEEWECGCLFSTGWSVRRHDIETQVVIGKNKKIYVWRRSHETFMPQCLGQYGDQDRQSAVSVLFWGCIT